MLGDKLRTAALSYTAPRALHGDGSPAVPGPFGVPVVLALVAGAAQVIDLRALTAGYVFAETSAETTAGTGAGPNRPQGAVGGFLTLVADGGDVGYFTGSTLAEVTGGNAPNLAAVGVVDGAGVYTPVAGCCFKEIMGGEPQRFRLMVGQDNFLAVVSAVNCIVRIYLSSEPGLHT